jgi:hypothetical protein
VRFSTEFFGFDARPLFVGIVVVGVVASAAFCAGGMRTFARFEDGGIAIGRPLQSRTRFYEYARVKGIEHRATFYAPAGNVVEMSHYAIVFDDGSEWTTRELIRIPDRELDERIIKFVAERSGRTIEEVH